MSPKKSPAALPLRDMLLRLCPGLALAAAVAFAATRLEPLLAQAAAAWLGRPLAIPAMVIALAVGIAFHPLARRPLFGAGLTFSVKRLLRWAIALLGVRIALADIVGLGLGTALMIVVTMAATLLSAIVLARMTRRGDAFGALAGGATAVCGASAALATSSVLPDYRRREADTIFVVVIVNALATLAMIGYPPLCAAFGFDDRMTGILLGASIHDVAQVVGAGYLVSDAAGNVATIVKLFRVFLLLPVVLGLGWWFSRRGGHAADARVPVPLFAFVFLALALLNSADLIPQAAKSVLAEASRWGLLTAIGALGLGTSFTAMLQLGLRPIAVVFGATVVTLVMPFLWLLAMR